MACKFQKVISAELVLTLALSGCAAATTNTTETASTEVMNSSEETIVTEEADTAEEVSTVSETEETGETETKSDDISDTTTDDSTDETSEVEEENAETKANQDDFQKEGKYPISWNLSTIYASVDDWNADYEKAMELIDELEKYKGTLNNAENIYDYFKFSFFSELSALLDKMNAYAELGLSLDASDSVYNELSSKLDTLYSKKNQLEAFADPEIFSMSLEEREKIFSDPVFDGMEYWLEYYTDPDYVFHSEEENNILAIKSKEEGYGEEIYNMLTYIELPNCTVTMPDGTEVELTETKYNDIIKSSEYDDEFKKKVGLLRDTRYKDYINTYALLNESNCQEHFAEAKIEGFDTSLEYEMDQNDLDTDLFYKLIDVAHEGIPDYQRYLDLHAQGLGVDTQYYYHTLMYASEYDPGKIAYDDAVDEVVDALSILGDDYIDNFTEIISSGQVDVYPGDTKESGAYEWQPTAEYLPWLLTNYNGYSDDISTIAHEMGHAVYNKMSTENQPEYYREPTLFTQEVASITNELLYYTYKINNAGDDSEKLYYLDCTLEMFSGTFFRQCLYSEFEDYMHKQVESGSALDGEDLSNKYGELLTTYAGDSVTYVPDDNYHWAAVPHFFYNYYVYMYAADSIYAASIVEKINSGDEEAIKSYKEFLTLGDSNTPVELLKVAGVDPTDEETYKYALEYYKNLVDEYERLIKNNG